VPNSAKWANAARGLVTEKPAMVEKHGKKPYGLAEHVGVARVVIVAAARSL